MSKVSDIDKARRKKLPQQSYVDMQFDDPVQWLSRVVSDGEVVDGVTGLHFGLDGVPGAIINADQCRRLAAALLQVAEHLEASE